MKILAPIEAKKTEPTPAKPDHEIDRFWKGFGAGCVFMFIIVILIKIL